MAMHMDHLDCDRLPGHSMPSAYVGKEFFGQKPGSLSVLERIYGHAPTTGGKLGSSEVGYNGFGE
jgi:hypothetical protein